MTDERELVQRNLEMQQGGRDFALIELPGYSQWAERKIEEGESEAVIAHMDSMSMFLLPEEAEKVSEQDFECLLEEIRDEVDD